MGHRSQQRSGKERQEAKYSHRIEEVGTPLTALEGLKDGRERRGGSGLLVGSCQAALKPPHSSPSYDPVTLEMRSSWLAR